MPEKCLPRLKVDRSISRYLFARDHNSSSDTTNPTKDLARAAKAGPMETEYSWDNEEDFAFSVDLAFYNR